LILICRGTAALRHGDLPAAATSAAAAAETALPGLEWIQQAALGQLAMVQAIAGELEQARRTAAEAAAVADRVALPSERSSPAAALGMALVSLEQCDLAAVDTYLEQASKPLLATENPVWRGLLAQVRAGLLRAEGQVPDALAVLEKALSDLAPGDAWLIDRLRVETAATLLQAEDVDLAERQLEAVHVTGSDVDLLSARVLAARGDATGSARTLARAQANPASLRTRVTALLLEASGIPQPCSADRARSDVLKALRLARPENLRRPFHEAPGPVRRLLDHDPHVKAQGRWLTVAEPDTRSPAGSGAGRALDAPEMVERLTAKEREILEHLAELLTTEEIARTMFISVNTVRTHIRSILRKLGVSRRNAAVRKARELGLLQP
jgi:LuxR family maltose regulon positive regulatory protein